VNCIVFDIKDNPIFLYQIFSQDSSCFFKEDFLNALFMNIKAYFFFQKSSSAIVLPFYETVKFGFARKANGIVPYRLLLVF